MKKDVQRDISYHLQPISIGSIELWPSAAATDRTLPTTVAIEELYKNLGDSGEGEVEIGGKGQKQR